MRILLPLVLATALTASRAEAQSRATFVVTSGADTIAVEHVTRLGDTTMLGDLRMPRQGAHSRYVVHLLPDGHAARVDVVDEAPEFFTGIVAFDAGPSAGRQRAPGNRAKGRIDAPTGSYPVVGTSVGLMEQLLLATHPRDSVSVRVVNVRNRLLGTATLLRVSSDSVRVTCDECQRANSHSVMELAISAAGRVVAGRDVEQDWTIVRE